MKPNSTYTIQVTCENGQLLITRTNDGFNALELIAILEMAKQDVLAQLKGALPAPEQVKRVVMVDKPEGEKKPLKTKDKTITD